MNALSLIAAAALLAGAAAPPRPAASPQGARRARSASEGRGRLTGVYRINLALSDRLYSVVAGASSNLPFAEQQRFFIDLTTRLIPPDQLAIERRGRTVLIASSRAPRTSFDADGRERREGGPGAYTRVRASLSGEQLTLNSRGSTGEDYDVTFTPTDGGRRLRVTRRISNRELNQPVVIQSVYDRISDVAQWAIYGEPKASEPAAGPVLSAVVPEASTAAERADAESLRGALEEWVAATNARDIARQMSFYAPTVRAFYLTRDVPARDVRREKARVFARAEVIDVRAEEPEIIFRDSGSVAIMRFRKRYRIEGGPASRRGEVLLELRWRRTPGGW